MNGSIPELLERSPFLEGLDGRDLTGLAADGTELTIDLDSDLMRLATGGSAA